MLYCWMIQEKINGQVVDNVLGIYDILLGHMPCVTTKLNVAHSLQKFAQQHADASGNDVVLKSYQEVGILETIRKS